MKELKKSLQELKDSIQQFCEEENLSPKQLARLRQLANEAKDHANSMPKDEEAGEASDWVEHAKWIIDNIIAFTLWYFT